MQVSLTHLRQNLFALADEVLRSGEPLLIERRGQLLKLVPAVVAAPMTGGRLARLRAQELTVGPALAPDESPSSWLADHGGALLAAEPPAPDYQPAADQRPASRRPGKRR